MGSRVSLKTATVSLQNGDPKKLNLNPNKEEYMFPASLISQGLFVVQLESHWSKTRKSKDQRFGHIVVFLWRFGGNSYV